MNELKDAAKAYYNNATEEQRSVAMAFFRALDIDGNGHVSLEELTEILRLPMGLTDEFSKYDQNGDGQLDFWEVLTIYYATKTTIVSCDTCRQLLTALYFTCVTCFESTCGRDTYDLCVGCYTRKAYSHEHRIFLDNHVLLRSKRNQNKNRENVPKDTIPQKNSTTHTRNVSQRTVILEAPQKNLELSDALTAVDVAFTILDVATSCNIM